MYLNESSDQKGNSFLVEKKIWVFTQANACADQVDAQRYRVRQSRAAEWVICRL